MKTKRLLARIGPKLREFTRFVKKNEVKAYFVKIFRFYLLSYLFFFIKNIPMSKDIRWIQRLDNFNSAFQQLLNAFELGKTKTLSDLEKQGYIQAFEFTHELAWNVIKDYFEYQGQSQITGSRDAAREAFNKGLIENGNAWMEMIKSRNLSSHTYNETVSKEITEKINTLYVPAFLQFQKKMNEFKAIK